MPVKGVSGTAIFATVVGGLLFYSGLTGKNFSSALQSVIAGKSPSTATSANPITGQPSLTAYYEAESGNIPQAPSTISGNVALGKTLAAAFGWTGQQFDALYDLWERESGWDAKISNPSSGAQGIAQSLHGTPGQEYSESDPEGLSSSELQAANQGSAYYQILWGLNYIKNTYGTPANAWAHEQAEGWY
jgi:hypothetical protein